MREMESIPNLLTFLQASEHFACCHAPEAMPRGLIESRSQAANESWLDHKKTFPLSHIPRFRPALPESLSEAVDILETKLH